MATRKQRRRREKEHRHEYEIVYLDDEGNEVEPDEAEIRGPAKRNPTTAGKASKTSAAFGRRSRAPQAPSWRRVAKRGAIFAPLFLATMLLLNHGKKNSGLADALAPTLFLVVFFVPFSYFLDSFMWRSYQKRQGGRATPKR
jgi:hypothetical protein